MQEEEEEAVPVLWYEHIPPRDRERRDQSRWPLYDLCGEGEFASDSNTSKTSRKKSEGEQHAAPQPHGVLCADISLVGERSQLAWANLDKLLPDRAGFHAFKVCVYA